MKTKSNSVVQNQWVPVEILTNDFISNQLCQNAFVLLIDDIALLGSGKFYYRFKVTNRSSKTSYIYWTSAIDLR